MKNNKYNFLKYFLLNFMIIFVFFHFPIFCFSQVSFSSEELVRYRLNKIELFDLNYTDSLDVKIIGYDFGDKSHILFESNIKEKKKSFPCYFYAGSNLEKIDIDIVYDKVKKETFTFHLIANEKAEDEFGTVKFINKSYYRMSIDNSKNYIRVPQDPGNEFFSNYIASALHYFDIRQIDRTILLFYILLTLFITCLFILIKNRKLALVICFLVILPFFLFLIYYQNDNFILTCLIACQGEDIFEKNISQSVNYVDIPLIIEKNYRFDKIELFNFNIIKSRTIDMEIIPYNLDKSNVIYLFKKLFFQQGKIPMDEAFKDLKDAIIDSSEIKIIFKDDNYYIESQKLQLFGSL